MVQYERLLGSGSIHHRIGPPADQPTPSGRGAQRGHCAYEELLGKGIFEDSIPGRGVQHREYAAIRGAQHELWQQYVRTGDFAGEPAQAGTVRAEADVLRHKKSGPPKRTAFSNYK